MDTVSALFSPPSYTLARREKEVYYKESSLVIWEADKSQDLHGESARWRHPGELRVEC